MKNIASLLITLSFLFSSCVEEYKLPSKVVNEYESEIVIQGRILAGEESIIYVSYTTPFNQEIPTPIVRNAQVSVVGQNGYRSEVAKYEPENNCYVIDTQNIDKKILYAVEVKVDGETYQSEFLKVLDTPSINEVTYKENEDGISIHVTTLVNEENSRHYMWGYEEDWEFHTEIDLARTTGKVPVYNERIYPLVNLYENLYYYCWMHRISRNVYLYSTEELTENSVKDVKLLDIPINDIRISYIYSILVKQWSLSEAAYYYYKTLKLYTEESGGLFTPMPTEIQGNVICVSNPQKRARGYVLASNVVTKRLFVYESDFKKLHSEYENCYMEEPSKFTGIDSWPERVDRYGYVALTPQGYINNESILYSPECVDCRKTKGATKKRPDFWPNNHE